MSGASLSSLIGRLRSTGLDVDAESAMDAAWLAVRLAGLGTGPGAARPDGSSIAPPPAARVEQTTSSASTTGPQNDDTSRRDRRGTAATAVRSGGERESPEVAGRVRLRVAAALPQSRVLARSLRPLRRRVASSSSGWLVDVDSTVRRAAEEGIWFPVIRPRPERWLDLALVIDRSVSMTVWTDAVAELKQMLTSAGAFRSITTWWLQTDAARPAVFRRQRDASEAAGDRRPRSLTPVARRGLVVVVTDCVSPRWYDGSVVDQLRDWSRGSMVTVANVLPQHLWARTALGSATQVRLRSPGEGVTNAHLLWTADFAWLPPDEEDSRTPPRTLITPVVSFEPGVVVRFARMIAGRGTDPVPGVFFELESMRAGGAAPRPRDMAPRERVARFFSVASAPARRLAAAFASSPIVSVRILRLLRQELMPAGSPACEAEVLVSGLVRVRHSAPAIGVDDVPLEFVTGVRALLLDNVTSGDAIRALRHAAEQAGGNIPGARTFLAALDRPAASEGALKAEDGDFVRAAADVLGRVGGVYARLVGGDAPTADVETQSDIPRPQPAADPSAPSPQRQEPAPQTWTPRLGHLSFPPRLFVDRAQDLSKLMQWWTDATAPRVMFILGEGGIGKTALAARFVQAVLQSAPPDGGFFVASLGAAAYVGDPMTAIVEYFTGASPRSDWNERDYLVAFRRAPTGKHHLLVLDDVESVGAESRLIPRVVDDLQRYFTGSFGGKMIVMSRSALPPPDAAVLSIGRLDEASIEYWFRQSGVDEQQARVLLPHIRGKPSELARVLDLVQKLSRAPRTRDDVQKEVADALQTKQWPAALALLDELLEIDRTAGETPLQAETLARRALVNGALLRREESEQDLREAIAIARQTEAQAKRAQALRSVGNVAHQLHDTYSAMELLSEALSLFEQLRLDPAIANTLGDLAHVALDRDELERALMFQQKRLNILEQLDDARGLAIAFGETARVAARATRLEQARSYFESALAGWQAVGDQDMVRSTQEEIGKLRASPELDVGATSSVSLQPGETLYVRPAIEYRDPADERHGEWLRTRGLHVLSVPLEFRVCPYLVTNDLFHVFVKDGGYANQAFWTGALNPRGRSFRSADGKGLAPAGWPSADPDPASLAGYPVTGICYDEAIAFIAWLNERIPESSGEWRWTLPTEDMWEYAARGQKGFVYPWGNEFRRDACNSAEQGRGRTSPVGHFVNGRSPSGGFDFAGNAWEFVEASDVRPDQCVLRGGSYLNTADEVKSYLRLTGVPRDHRPPDFGFRCAQVKSGTRARAMA